GAKEFLDRYAELLRLIAAGYRREGKRYVTITPACTTRHGPEAGEHRPGPGTREVPAAAGRCSTAPTHGRQVPATSSPDRRSAGRATRAVLKPCSTGRFAAPVPGT
ncbi:hypothetical protein AB0C13_30680, partial [Streptomyces sp. NPDC049099]